MSGAKTVAQAQRGIAKAVKAAGKDEALRELIAQTMSRADMAGRQMVDLYEMGPRQLSLDVGTAQDPRTFLNLPWDEALAAFKQRPRGAAELSTLLKGNAEAAGVSHQLLLEGIQKRVNEMLAKSIDEGGTFPEFAQQIAAEADGLGITNQSPAYLECLPADTQVSGAVIRAAHRRWYQGDMVEVVTASGCKFSATPNHPMLTRAGWRGAGELREGDDLIGYCRQQDATILRDDDVAEPPASIAELFATCEQVGNLERTRSTKHDFHGDGRDGNVDVARTTRLLRVGAFAAITQPLEHHVFSEADESGPRFCSACGNLVIVTKRCGFCDVPVVGASVLQASPDDVVAGSEIVSELVSARAGLVASDNLSDGDVGSRGFTASLPASVKEQLAGSLDGPGNARLADHAVDTAAGAPDQGGNRGGAQPGEIEFDRVVALRVYAFDGHVYNLSTEHGYFTIHGLFTGNTVFRTNVLGAYGQGRHEAMSDPDVISARPFRQWRTSLDNRVRHSHADMEGQVWRADNPAMAGLKTPVDYQDRCSIVTLATWDGPLLESIPPGLVSPGFE